MQHNRTLRVITAFLLLTAGIILFLILNVCIGTVSIPFKDILSSIRGQEVLNARILWDIRMPRTLAALILGGALDIYYRPFSIIRLQDLLCSESHPERK